MHTCLFVVFFFLKTEKHAKPLHVWWCEYFKSLSVCAFICSLSDDVSVICILLLLLRNWTQERKRVENFGVFLRVFLCVVLFLKHSRRSFYHEKCLREKNLSSFITRAYTLSFDYYCVSVSGRCNPPCSSIRQLSGIGQLLSRQYCTHSGWLLCAKHTTQELHGALAVSCKYFKQSK